MKENSKGTLLIVDDEPNNINVLNTLFEKSGYEIRIAENGEAALRVVSLELPDIILMDIIMPGIDGFETCRRLKAEQRTKDIPVLFMTAVTTTADKVRGFQIGAVDFITKPYQGDEVLARVEMHLKLKRMRKEIETKNARLEEEIATRKQAEEKLQQHLAELEEIIEERTEELRNTQEELLVKERLAVMGHFAGSMSHEIRNPLSVIYGSAYYLKMKLSGSNEVILQYLDRISANARKINSIIESLLSLTRMEKPARELRDLSEIINEAILVSKIPDDIKLIRTNPEYRVLIRADQEQLIMALKNIIHNAVQAIQDVSRNLSDLPQESRLLTLKVLENQNGNIEVRIADTGVGIRTEHLKQIFLPLFTTRSQSVGFGLSIAKTIIEKHEGSIHVESEIGKGTVFTIRLPIDRDEETIEI